MSEYGLDGVLSTVDLRIGNGTEIVTLSTIGTRYGNSVSTPYASKTNGTTRPQLTRESKRKADTEIQYRPRIVDADPDFADPVFADPVFADPFCETPS